MDLEGRLATLERQQTLCQARNDLWQTITRDARGIDEQRDKELAEIFTDDVVRQTQPWTQCPLVGKVLARKAFRNSCQAFQHPRRCLTNHQLSINDDGTARGYATWFVVQAREDHSYGGWRSYEWELRWEEGLWKISRMCITLDGITHPRAWLGHAGRPHCAFPATGAKLKGGVGGWYPP